MNYSLNLGHMYPDLLNLYGDRGNIMAIMKRCMWRGIDIKLHEFGIKETVDFEQMDICFIGGGSDKEQIIVGKTLLSYKEQMRNFIESDGVVVAICGGYQLLGEYYQSQLGQVDGLDILKIRTEKGSKRLIGNVAIDSPFGKVVGFENHGGYTYIDGYEPFGKVLAGYGNNDQDKAEGILYKNVIGTYLHGPLLPKNPHITDQIILKALKRKYGDDVQLEVLDDEVELRAQHSMLKRLGVEI